MVWTKWENAVKNTPKKTAYPKKYINYVKGGIFDTIKPQKIVKKVVKNM